LQLARRLKSNFKVIENKDPIDASNLSIDNAQVVIFGGPRDKFNKSELAVIQRLIDDGGSVIILLGEGGEAKYGTNINALLEEYGVYINSDCCVRTVYHKYLHPKEVYVQGGVLNREVTRAATKMFGASKLAGHSEAALDASTGAATHETHASLAFVCPYGSTLNVQKPAVPLLSTGQEAYPLSRPLVAVWDGTKQGKGKILVVSSTKMFDDEWLTKEDNSKVWDVLMKWMTPKEEIKLNQNDADEPEIDEYHHVPDHGALANRMRCCLQEAEEVPQDFSSLFDESLFKFDTDSIPEAIKLYSELDVKHELLTLIPPQFEAPLPPLQPAVFPPALREPPPPRSTSLTWTSTSRLSVCGLPS